MEGLINFEIKAILVITNIAFLNEYYVETLHQTDTYYKTTDGRLKLREEIGKDAYMVRYDRVDVAKERICKYDFFTIPDAKLFRKVFNGALQEDVVVKKERKLYIYKNARIHLDSVEGLSESFVEIEVVIRNEEQKKNAPELMAFLLNKLSISDSDKLSKSYRELIKERGSL